MVYCADIRRSRCKHSLGTRSLPRQRGDRFFVFHIMRTFEFPSTIQARLAKGIGDWVVGGIASSFHRDLDDEAITPEAVERAIPQFMEGRGKVKGGPLHLHHNFWQRFLREAIDALLLNGQEKKELIGAIALPLGRVTKIWVDGQGRTHWKGVLSQQNPIAKILWQMLKEGMVHLGVSLGGKILSTKPGFDALGQPCTVIDRIRLDEISITSNPALRLTRGEDTGAYISALAKSAATIYGRDMMAEQKQVERFLAKALKSGEVHTGMGRPYGEPQTKSPRGGGNVRMDNSTVNTGMGRDYKDNPRQKPTSGGGKDIKTDVWGMTAGKFTRSLSKAAGKCGADPKQWGDESLRKSLQEGAYGLTTVTPNPPEALINLVKTLQYISQYAPQLPMMDAYRAEQVATEMQRMLNDAIAAFQMQAPPEVLDTPMQAPGEAGMVDVVLPDYFL